MLDRAWAALDRGDPARARLLARRCAGDPAHRAEAYHLLGRAALDADDPEKALDLLGRARDLGGDWADLLYDIGIAHEAIGDLAARTEAFLEVLALDEQEDPELTGHLGEDDLVAAAEESLEELPEEMLSRLGTVPVLVEERPAAHLVEEGFDPRALGLFDGPPWSEQGLTGPASNRIVLYRANIAAAAQSPREAARQIRITLLHETAHFFGLDEDEVAALGLA